MDKLQENKNDPEFRKRYAEEWDRVCKQLKSSRYDLSRIRIVLKER